jgi:hypothetical protein
MHASSFLIHICTNVSQKEPGNWTELMEGCVRENTELQHQLMQELVQYGDYALAARFAQKFKLEASHLPQQVQPELLKYKQIHRYRTFKPSRQETTGSTEFVDFYQLPLPFSSIHLIDNVCDFKSCLRTILQVSLYTSQRHIRISCLLLLHALNIISTAKCCCGS